jgi:hypothetical protein
VGLVETTAVGKALLLVLAAQIPMVTTITVVMVVGVLELVDTMELVVEVDIMEVEAIIIHQIGALVLEVLDTVHQLSKIVEALSAVQTTVEMVGKMVATARLLYLGNIKLGSG